MVRKENIVNRPSITPRQDDAQTIRELGMLIRMLLRHVPDDKQIKARATDYLMRHGLHGSPLRGAALNDGPNALNCCVRCGADLSVIRMVACCDAPLKNEETPR